jgi:hypothetical protein
MKVISTTYEMVHGAHIYRLIEDAKGVMIRRTPNVDYPLWSHGVITQMLNENGEFMMGIVATQPMHLKTLNEAVQLIKEQK